MFLLLAIPTANYTGAYSALQPTFVPTVFNYLPLVARDWEGRPVPVNTAIPFTATPTIVHGSATPTITQTPTLTSTPTATPVPVMTNTEQVGLYACPDNLGCATLALLAEGSEVLPLAIYRDYVKVSRADESDGVLEGFVRAEHLNDLPGDLPELTENDVPWKELIDLFGMIYDPNIAVEDDSLWVDNNGAEGWYVRTFGPIQVDNHFRVALNLDGSSGFFGGFSVAGKEEEGHRLSVGYFEGSVLLQVRGTTEESVTRITLSELSVHEPFSFTFSDAQGRQVTFFDSGGSSVRQIDLNSLEGISLPSGLFPDGEMYAGIWLGPDSQLQIDGFLLDEPPSGEFRTPPPDTETLRQLARQMDFGIGTAALKSYHPLRDLRYQDILVNEYNRFVLEEFAWDAIRPERDSYDFTAADVLVDFALKHNMEVEGHHLIYEASPALPAWLTSGDFTREELIEILRDYIHTVVGRYRGKVHTWSVVNEVVARSMWLPEENFWYQSIGPEVFDMAFRWAREADPDAVLILNENNNHETVDEAHRDLVNEIYDVVSRLKRRGVPIDGIGMQMHLLPPNTDNIRPTKSQVLSTMRRFGQLDVRIYVTELDVNVADVPGSREQRWAYQAEVYRDMLEACLESDICDGFSTFGFTDAVSWYGDCSTCFNIPEADPLLFDDNYQPKPAYFALRDVLRATSQP